jgi:hypothetical protein
MQGLSRTLVRFDTVSVCMYPQSTHSGQAVLEGIGGMHGITAQIVRQTQATHGCFDWDEWQRFYAALGLEYVLMALPDDMDGLIYGRTVFLRQGMCPSVLALTAWHEAGHYLMHDGNVTWWSRQPEGKQTMARYERQASLFAAMFPRWDAEEEG